MSGIMSPTFPKTGGKRMDQKAPEELARKAAARFRYYRKVRNITAKEVSEKSGVPYSTVRRFETTGEISFVSLVKIISALRLDEQIEALFGDPRPETLEDLVRLKHRVRLSR
jgi:transcriptional regulator with XRE-family HTH domain